MISRSDYDSDDAERVAFNKYLKLLTLNASATVSSNGKSYNLSPGASPDSLSFAKVHAREVVQGVQRGDEPDVFWARLADDVLFENLEGDVSVSLTSHTGAVDAELDNGGNLLLRVSDTLPNRAVISQSDGSGFELVFRTGKDEGPGDLESVTIGGVGAQSVSAYQSGNDVRVSGVTSLTVTNADGSVADRNDLSAIGTYSVSPNNGGTPVISSTISLSSAMVIASEQIFTGRALTPVPSVTLDGKQLKVNEDFEIVGYTNNTAIGTASVTVRGIGAYEGTAIGHFKIAAVPAPKKVTQPKVPPVSQPGIADGASAVVGDATYLVVSNANNSVYYMVAPKSKKSVTIPASVNIAGKDYTVVGISAGAFAGTKAKTVTVKTPFLTKASVKGCFKGAKKAKTVKVKAAKGKANKKLVNKYKKFFAKKNSGKKVTVK